MTIKQQKRWELTCLTMETAPEPETKETQNTAENAPLVSDEPQSSSRDVQRPSDETGASNSQTASKVPKYLLPNPLFCSLFFVLRER
jgi:hypothetical protein